MKKKAIVVVDPEILSGTPCFDGTRVPVRNLLDYLEGGETLDAFLEQFSTVSRQQAVAFLEQASARLLATLGGTEPRLESIPRRKRRRLKPAATGL